jgi:hypothetical protein
VEWTWELVCLLAYHAPLTTHHALPPFPPPPYSQLKALPSKLPELSGLQRLIACHNKLESDGVPDGVDDLRELEEIDLSYNQLKTVPESVHYLKDRAHILLQGNPLDEETLRSYHTHTWTPSKRFKVSSAEIIGRRPTMEDALSLQGHFQGRDDVDFFGLFDGHAGRGVAEYCADHVHTVVLDKLKDGSDTQGALKDCWVNVNSGLKVFTSLPSHTHSPPMRETSNRLNVRTPPTRPSSMVAIPDCGMRAPPLWLRWSRAAASS